MIERLNSLPWIKSSNINHIINISFRNDQSLLRYFEFKTKIKIVQESNLKIVQERFCQKIVMDFWALKSYHEAALQTVPDIL